MRRGLAFLAGGLGLAGLLRLRRRRPETALEPDPRAAELRAKLEESRAVVDERDEFEQRETPVDEAEPVDVDARRRDVHEQGRAAIDELRGTDD